MSEAGAVVTPEEQQERASLLELLDRVANKGVVISGDLVISVADVDLIYLGLRVLLTSVETALETGTLPVRPEPIQRTEATSMGNDHGRHRR